MKGSVLAPRLAGVAQPAVETRGEGEADADFAQAPGDVVGGEVERQAQGFKDIGGADRRPASVASKSGVVPHFERCGAQDDIEPARIRPDIRTW